MRKEGILEDLFKAIVNLKEKTKETVAELVKENFDLLESIERGLSRGMKAIGEKFEKLEIFLPELLMYEGFRGALRRLGYKIYQSNS